MKILTRSPRLAPVVTLYRHHCDDELLHCHHTLVLHADGTAECEGVAECDVDPAVHEHCVPCTELAGCGCTGDEHDLVDVVGVAA